jgi:SMI1 / KNR4 family (SUKH-1)
MLTGAGRQNHQGSAAEGHMTEADVAALEGSLGVVLPDHYRRFLLNYPQPLIDTKLDLGWAQEAPADRQLANSGPRLIALNRDVRLPGTPWVGEAGEPWPDNYFVIGDDQCGNYWCVDLRTADPGVWFYNHEVADFERQHGSLPEFAQALLAEIGEFNRKHGRAGPGAAADRQRD